MVIVNDLCSPLRSQVIGAKTSDDFHRLTNELMDQRRLRISIAEINPADRTDRYRKPISDNEVCSSTAGVLSGRFK